MSRAVQILLLAAMLPMIGTAREETLEERKKRITRKYMRERMEISSSDMVVPVEVLPEDDQVLDSERFKDPEVELSRQSASPAPPPPQRRPIPEQQEENWLLQGLDDETRDPYADPFALDKSPEQERDVLSAYNKLRNRDSGYDSQESGSGYGSRSYDPYASRNRYFGSTRYGNESGDPSTDQSDFTRYGWQGRQADSPRTPGSQLYQPRTYGASPDSGLLNTPFPQYNSTEETEYRRPGMTGQSDTRRYNSPYQTRRETRSTYGNETTRPGQQQDFRKPNTYQDWKDKNKTWDPTSDDAYLDELMRRNRR